MKKAGIDELPVKGHFTAVKIHFGEPGNLAYLRPNYAKVIVDIVKENGGKVFLTDCNTLYVAAAKMHWTIWILPTQTAIIRLPTGCHIIIADGLKGLDEEKVPIEGGEYVKEAKIGQAVMDADVFISLTHFKCHENTGFGGTFKNIGMGCGSRAGKMEMHSAGQTACAAGTVCRLRNVPA